MSPISHFALSILLILAGWLLHGIAGGRWRWVPRMPKLNQDARHYWLRAGGRLFAFTWEQLQVAEARAQHLEEPRRRWGRAAILTLVICGLLSVMLLAGCGYARRVDPPIYRYADAKVAEQSARLHAAEAPNRQVHQNVCCGSMRPLIQQGDWIVTEATPYGEHLIGKPGVYRPKWNQGKPVLHRFVSGNAKEGFIPSGDNTPRSEAWERVTAANYESEVIAIYRHEPGA